MARKASNGHEGLRKPPLTVDQILAWAKAHHKRTGRWPHAKAGVATPVRPGFRCLLLASAVMSESSKSACFLHFLREMSELRSADIFD
jgi:hypothetical protein